MPDTIVEEVEPPKPMRRDDTTARDLFSGMPWWVRAALLVGAPMAIMTWLVWSDRVQMRDQVTEARTILTGMVISDAAHDMKVTVQFNQLATESRETNRILIASCVNNATNDAQRNACIGK